jgi:hypothetical protein
MSESLTVSDDGSRLVEIRKRTEGASGGEAKASPLEKDINRLVEDIAQLMDAGPDTDSEISRLATTLEYNRQFDADYQDYMENNPLTPHSGTGPDPFQDLIHLADTAYLWDIIPLLEKLRGYQFDDAEINSDLENLHIRTKATPTEMFGQQTPTQFVASLLRVPVEDILRIWSGTNLCTTIAECKYYKGTPHPYYSLVNVVNPDGLPDQLELEDTRQILKDMGEQLFNARAELGIMVNYSKAIYPEIYKRYADRNAHRIAFMVKAILLSLLAAILWWLTWITVDVNLTSIHGLYRDRLATAFLVGVDLKGDIDIEKDLDLGDICTREAGSIAPYHLVNTALNLQGSKDISIRDRRSDFFVFSKRFIGGKRTAYCRSETMEMVFPQMGLSSAMAISAAAASPNMGRSTSPALVAIMTLLNIRLGYWVPNPGLLERWVWKRNGKQGEKDGYSFEQVMREELIDVERRWELLPDGSDRQLADNHRQSRSTRHKLVGIGFSGGGIRSAAVNLGIAQAFHQRGVFDHIDYMSTVSGGGYLGSSISALMRRETKTFSELKGRVSLSESEDGKKVISITPMRNKPTPEPREYRYASYANLAVEDGAKVKKGQRLILPGKPSIRKLNSLGSIYHWRVRPGSLLREVTGKLKESRRWVNVSDGGHIENLAGIELLRRRCRYIVIGDGEADPKHHFNGLATLVRSARIDLGIHIDINLDQLRLNKKGKCRSHWAFGTIHYPDKSSPPGHLLYLKSSFTGDEDEVIQEYRHAHPSFPHESTADQAFSEGQFEAYRSLGQHIAEQAMGELHSHEGGMKFSDLEDWFEVLAQRTSTKA